MNRIFDETMIIESLAENKVRLHGMDEPITDLDMSIDDVTYRFGRHYSFDFKLGQKWFADVLDIRKNVPSCLCLKKSVIFFVLRCSETKLPIWFRHHPMMKYKKCLNHGNYISIGKKRVFKATFSRFQFNCQIKRIDKFIKKNNACVGCPVIKCRRC